MSDHTGLPRVSSVPARRLDISAAALWASAFVILALVIMQAGRSNSGGAPAYAGNVSLVGDLAILTAEAGDQEDILAILDRRSERMFIYGVNSRREVELFQNYDIGRVFAEAREASGQTRRP